MIRGKTVKFTLYYKGPLKSNSRANEKQRLRDVWRPQLEIAFANFYQIQVSQVPEYLNSIFNRSSSGLNPADGGWRFFPLVSDFLFKKGSHLELDILMLRRGPLGNVVIHGGDIDNRLKTLFDSLQSPSPEQCAKLGPCTKNIVFACLLTDDRQISRVNVRTASLLDTTISEKEVILVIDVSVVGVRNFEHL